LKVPFDEIIVIKENLHFLFDSLSTKEDNILVIKNTEKLEIEKSEKTSSNAVPGKPTVFFHHDVNLIKDQKEKAKHRIIFRFKIFSSLSTGYSGIFNDCFLPARSVTIFRLKFIQRDLWLLILVAQIFLIPESKRRLLQFNRYGHV
jgi:hypothetical protein